MCNNNYYSQSYNNNSTHEITIFEWYLPFTSRKWIWTAITRTTDLDKVYIYDGKVEGDDDKLINNYFNNKIDGYKKQDLKSKRNVSNNYVNVEWLRSCLGKACKLLVRTRPERLLYPGFPQFSSGSCHCNQYKYAACYIQLQPIGC
jgi:hypothetical protein